MQEEKKKMGPSRKWDFFLGRNKRPIQQEFQEKIKFSNDKLLEIFLNKNKMSLVYQYLLQIDNDILLYL